MDAKRSAQQKTRFIVGCSLCVATLAIELICTSLAGAQDSVPSGIENQALREELWRLALDIGLDEESAAEIVNRYGAEAMGKLIEFIKDPKSDPRVVGMGCLVLAKTQDPRARDAIIEYVKRPLPAELDRWECSAMNLAMTALGWIGDPPALECLKMLAGDKHWESLSTKPVTSDERKYNAARTRLMLRKFALSGLAGSSSQSAVAILRDLKKADAADMAVPVDRAIGSFELMASEGN